MFTDGNALYTGAITGAARSMTGLAGRITVNAALLTDPSKFTIYNTSPATTAGDTTRPDFLYSQLTSGTFTYSPQTGLGHCRVAVQRNDHQLHAAVPQSAGQRADLGDAVAAGPGRRASARCSRKFNSTAGVSIDTEMSNLIAMQNTYAANAHVMSVVQTMMTSLMQVQV